jgi:excisionase family DNA binding protein
MERATMSLEQVATYLNVSSQTVRRLVSRGKLKAVRIGKSLRVEEKALADFLNQAEVKER